MCRNAPTPKGPSNAQLSKDQPRKGLPLLQKEMALWKLCFT
jgi:hypothetical protein